jgi:hypothetical protein
LAYLSNHTKSYHGEPLLVLIALFHSNTIGTSLYNDILNQDLIICDIAEVPDLSVSGDNSNLAEDDPRDLTTMSKPEAPMQSLNQLPVVTDLADARLA